MEECFSTQQELFFFFFYPQNQLQGPVSQPQTALSQRGVYMHLATAGNKNNSVMNW